MIYLTWISDLPRPLVGSKPMRVPCVSLAPLANAIRKHGRPLEAQAKPVVIVASHIDVTFHDDLD